MRYIMMFLFVMLVGIVVAVALAFCEEPEPITAWIICQPNSVVNVRRSPKKDSEISAFLFPGKQLTLDGKVRNGFVHCVGLNAEDPEGWVYEGFVSYIHPIEDGNSYCIRSDGRVACRRYINGPRRSWLHDGDKVTIYSRTVDWCVTNRGFVQTKYIDLSAPEDVNNMDPDEMDWEE